MDIKVGVSNHHIHVTRETLDILFGEGYELTNKRDLLQIGQFAAEETVTLERNGKTLEHIRIIGPCRNYTQVELLERDKTSLDISWIKDKDDLEDVSLTELMQTIQTKSANITNAVKELSKLLKGIEGK